jgi:peptide/nickel transport system substrate-binding protein
MIVGVQGLPASLDPEAELSNVGTRVSYTPYDTLIRRDFLNNNEHVPSLALSWERLSDTVLELKLREDVTFHNGDPFTADDVVFTFERLLNAADDSPLQEARTYFAGFTGVEAVDDYTVRIETAAPDPLIVKRLASWASWIVPKSYFEDVGEEEFRLTGMGTGPYKFVSFDLDNELVLERYDGYWGDPAPLKRLVFRVIPEIAARVTALINDEVQIITNVPPDQVSAISDASNVEVRSVPLANTHVLSYNAHHPALADKKLRQALNLGIDRQLIIDTIWNGQAVPKRSHQFEEYGPLFNPDRPLTPYDPDRARQLIEESNYNGELIEYQLQAGYYTNGEQVAQAIVPMWQEIGINAEVRINESSISGEERIVHTWSNSSILADPDGSLWRSWGAESGQQRNYWDAPAEFNELGEEARTTLDEQKRYENYQRMLDIWEDEAPGTVLFDPVEFYAVNLGVNWSPYPFYYMDLRAYNLSFNE